MRAFFRLSLLIATVWVGGFLIQGCEVSYILRQGYHQAKLLSQRRDVTEVLADPSIGVEAKEKIRFIEELCEFATMRLRLERKGSYRSFVQLKRDHLGYVISACPRDSLRPLVWSFPLLGEFPYKGFFSLEDALEEKKSLELRGFDVHLGLIGAFSALGWFRDPIYSTMLKMDDLELAQTIFHELVHSNVFFKDKVEFNEQVATFVGWEACLKFFQWRYGEDSQEAIQVMEALDAEKALSAFLGRWMSRLSDLYSSLLSTEEKLLIREEIFAALISEARNLAQTHRRLRWLGEVSWNNASFMALWRYRYDIGEMEVLYSFVGGDLEALLLLLKQWERNGGDPEEEVKSLLCLKDQCRKPSSSVPLSR